MGFSLRKLGRALDPTRKGSVVRGALRKVDPTVAGSLTRRAINIAGPTGFLVGSGLDLAQGGVRGLVRGRLGAARDAAILGAASLAVPAIGGAMGGAGAGALGAGRSIIGKLGSVAGRVGNFALDNPELLAAGLSAYSGAQQAGQADQLRRSAIGSLQIPQAEDTSALFANPSNPYAGRAPIQSSPNAARAALRR